MNRVGSVSIFAVMIASLAAFSTYQFTVVDSRLHQKRFELESKYTKAMELNLHELRNALSETDTCRCNVTLNSPSPQFQYDPAQPSDLDEESVELSQLATYSSACGIEKTFLQAGGSTANLNSLKIDRMTVESLTANSTTSYNGEIGIYYIFPEAVYGPNYRRKAIPISITATHAGNTATITECSLAGGGGTGSQYYSAYMEVEVENGGSWGINRTEHCDFDLTSDLSSPVTTPSAPGDISCDSSKFTRPLAWKDNRDTLIQNSLNEIKVVSRLTPIPIQKGWSTWAEPFGNDSYRVYVKYNGGVYDGDRVTVSAFAMKYGD